MFRGLQCLNRAIKKRLFLLYIVKHARVKKTYDLYYVIFRLGGRQRDKSVTELWKMLMV